VAAPADLTAQEALVDGIEVWSGVGGWATGPNRELPVGWRIGLAVGVVSTARLGFALEALYGNHAPEGRTLSAHEVGLGLRVGRTVIQRGRAAVFLRGRVGWSRRSGDGRRVDLKQDALAVGSEVGVDVAVSERVGIVSTLAGNALWHRRERLDGGVVRGSTGGFGTQWGLRIGARILTTVNAGAATAGGPG
jgi:hypothetical protein